MRAFGPPPRVVDVGKTEAPRRLMARFGWGFADQALSSLTNFLLGIFVARSVDALGFGAFSVAFTAYLVALGISRALTTEPLVVRFSSTRTETWKEGTRAATGAAVLIGVLLACLCAAAALIFSGQLRVALLILAPLLPGLLLQDTWRYAFFAADRDKQAFINDLIWAIVLFPALTVLLVTESATVGWLIAVWGGAAAAAAVAGIRQAGLIPAPNMTPRWFRDQRDLAPRFLGEFSIGSGVSQLTLLGIGAVASLAELGSLRAGQILMGPLNVLFLGAGLVTIPEGVRIQRQSVTRLRKYVLSVAAVLAFFTLGWGITALTLPDALGRAILAANWAAAQPVILPLTVSMIAFGFTTSAGAGLRALAAARESLRAKCLSAPGMATAGLVGASMAGSIGAAWGLAIGQTAAAAIWWAFLAHAIRARTVRGSARVDGVHQVGATTIDPPAEG
jgi:O-antigen/teichoic acid export membrane protein